MKRKPAPPLTWDDPSRDLKAFRILPFWPPPPFLSVRNSVGVCKDLELHHIQTPPLTYGSSEFSEVRGALLIDIRKFVYQYVRELRGAYVGLHHVKIEYVGGTYFRVYCCIGIVPGGYTFRVSTNVLPFIETVSTMLTYPTHFITTYKHMKLYLAYNDDGTIDRITHEPDNERVWEELSIEDGQYVHLSDQELQILLSVFKKLETQQVSPLTEEEETLRERLHIEQAIRATLPTKT